MLVRSQTNIVVILVKWSEDFFPKPCSSQFTHSFFSITLFFWTPHSYLVHEFVCLFLALQNALLDNLVFMSIWYLQPHNFFFFFFLFLNSWKVIDNEERVFQQHFLFNKFSSTCLYRHAFSKRMDMGGKISSICHYINLI